MATLTSDASDRIAIDVRSMARVRDGRRILSDVTFAVRLGECLAIVGQPGSGRTTLLRMLATLVPPTTGAIAIAGADAAVEPIQLRARLVYLDAACTAGAGLCAAEYAHLIVRTRRPDRSGNRSDVVVTRAGVDAGAPIDRLPAGDRAALALSAALAVEPDVLLADDLDLAAGTQAWPALARALAEACRSGATTAVAVVSDGLARTLGCRRALRLSAGLATLEDLEVAHGA